MPRLPHLERHCAGFEGKSLHVVSAVLTAHLREDCQAVIILGLALERAAGPDVGTGLFHFDSLSLTFLSLPFEEHHTHVFLEAFLPFSRRDAGAAGLCLKGPWAEQPHTAGLKFKV